MIIDSHCHIFPESFQDRRILLTQLDKSFKSLFENPKASLGTTQQLIVDMDRDCVDISVIMGIGWTDKNVGKEANDHIIQSVKEYPERLVGFCSINPLWGEEAIREIERCITAGLKGIGELHPDTQDLDITNKEIMEPVMNPALRLGLPVVIHSSEPVGHSYPGKGNTTPDKLLAFINNFPNNKIICAHWGGGLPFYDLMPEVNENLKNVYFDTAASPFLYDQRIFNVVSSLTSPERVLLASDYPLIPHRRVSNQLDNSSLNETQKSDIRGGNAKILLNL